MSIVRNQLRLNLVPLRLVRVVKEIERQGGGLLPPSPSPISNLRFQMIGQRTPGQHSCYEVQTGCSFQFAGMPMRTSPSRTSGRFAKCEFTRSRQPALSRRVRADRGFPLRRLRSQRVVRVGIARNSRPHQATADQGRDAVAFRQYGDPRPVLNRRLCLDRRQVARADRASDRQAMAAEEFEGVRGTSYITLDGKEALLEMAGSWCRLHIRAVREEELRELISRTRAHGPRSRGTTNIRGDWRKSWAVSCGGRNPTRRSSRNCV